MAAIADGFEVFPLVPRSKVPYAGSHGHLDATDDPVLVSRWHDVKPDANLGLRMPEGFVCLDVDAPREFRRWCAREGLPLPPTREVRTRRGRHLYYRLPDLGESRLRTRLADVAVDVKSRSGFTVGPGSVHQTGFVYRCTRQVPLDEVPVLPDEWLPWVTRPAVQEESAGSGQRLAAGQKATRHHPRSLGRVMYGKSEGTRRDFLRWASCEAWRCYSGEDLAVALAELETGALAAGLEQETIDGLLDWAADQYEETNE